MPPPLPVRAVAAVHLGFILFAVFVRLRVCLAAIGRRGRVLTPVLAGARISAFCLALAACLGPGKPARAEIIPFPVRDQHPLAIILGLPPPEGASLLSPGASEQLVTFDAANTYVTDTNDHERLILDGESHRWDVSYRFGLTPRVEAGFDIPWISRGGGCLDGLIDWWHDRSDLPEGGRHERPRNASRYLYRDDEDGTLLDVSGEASGPGDIRLVGAVQLGRDRNDPSRALALRVSLELPTGDEENLLGSGSTDLALWLEGSSSRMSTGWGPVSVFGSAGGMVAMGGGVMDDRRRDTACFGGLGLGWEAASWLDLKAQLSGHTPLYGGSDLPGLERYVLQLALGGSLRFSRLISLEIAVIEELITRSSTDLWLHLALRRSF